MHEHYSTRNTAPWQAAPYWRDVIDRVYFHLQLRFRDESRFEAQVAQWSLGPVTLSRLRSSPLLYRRLREHCSGIDPQMLVTVPVHSPVSFTQLGRTTECSPGRFLVEHSDDPYDFAHSQPNDMWVIKLAAAALESRIGHVSRCCAQNYDCQDGIGRLFSDYLGIVTRHCDEGLSNLAHGHVRTLMGQQLIDLLALALQRQPEAVHSTQQAVRRAHIARIRNYVRIHVGNPDLDPARIAEANGISLRYLHALFHEDGVPIAQWLRQLRLQLAHERLRQAATRVSITQVAADLGFRSPAHFSHVFRKQFGCSPSDVQRDSPTGQTERRLSL